jgi:hypothetical protein
MCIYVVTFSCILDREIIFKGTKVFIEEVKRSKTKKSDDLVYSLAVRNKTIVKRKYDENIV